MKVDEQFPARLLSLRSSLGLTQSELAKLVGVAQRTIASYEIGESSPRLKALLRLASALHVTPEMLSYGSRHEGKNEDTGQVNAKITKTPIYTDEQIISRFKGDEQFVESERFIHTDLRVSDASFAYLIRDDSMMASEGGEYSFPVGSIVVFDPSVPPKSGDFVLVILYGLEPLVFFRRFAGGMEVVKFSPLNTTYPRDEVAVVSLREDSIRVIPAVSVIINLPANQRAAVSNLSMQVISKTQYPTMDSYAKNEKPNC
jgi:transcriptional regulator with XRE-family HTH domain